MISHFVVTYYIINTKYSDTEGQDYISQYFKMIIRIRTELCDCYFVQAGI